MGLSAFTSGPPKICLQAGPQTQRAQTCPLIISRDQVPTSNPLEHPAHQLFRCIPCTNIPCTEAHSSRAWANTRQINNFVLHKQTQNLAWAKHSSHVPALGQALESYTVVSAHHMAVGGRLTLVVVPARPSLHRRVPLPAPASPLLAPSRPRRPVPIPLPMRTPRGGLHGGVMG